MPKVLIVEDDEVIAQGMARHLGAAGFDPVSVGNGTQGLARLRYEKPDVCVLDLMLPGVDGWKLIETARNEGIGTPIVVVCSGAKIVLDLPEDFEFVRGVYEALYPGKPDFTTADVLALTAGGPRGP